MFKSIFNPFLSTIFAIFSQKSYLNRKIICFSLVSLLCGWKRQEDIFKQQVYIYFPFLWQITSKLNWLLAVPDYQHISQNPIRILFVSASWQQITSKLNYVRRGMRLHCQNDLFVPVMTPNS